MSDEQKKRQSAAVTTTVTKSEPEVDERSLEALTPLEEKVLRMLHGLSESDEHELKFALGADEEQTLRLAALEQHLLESFERDELPEGLVGTLGLDAD